VNVPYASENARDWLALRNEHAPRTGPLSPEEFAAEEAKWDPAHFRLRVLRHAGGQPVGQAELAHLDFDPPGSLHLRLWVSPAARGVGHGAALLAWAQAAARQAGRRGLVATVPDTDPATRTWGEQRGFRFVLHRFASTLDLGTVDHNALARPLPPGVRLADLNTEADRPGYLAWLTDRLWETPDLGHLPRWSEAQVRAMLRWDTPDCRPEWHVLALDAAGQRLGVSILVPIRSGLYNEFTGVVPAWRGRGLARALKLEAIRRARAAGYTRMLTNNHSANAAMLRVNAALGYRPQAGAWELQQTLTDSP
jgi:GNAT superfamily N-acetyltransferase